MKFVLGTVLFVFVFHKAATLQCWKCSSDIDHTCSDPFNDVTTYRSSSSYNSQSYNQRQIDNNYNRQYDPNYNRQYDPNYNRQYDQNYNPVYNTGLRNDYNSRPMLEVCDENDARNRRMKNVCLKEIVRGSNYVSVVRRCELVPYEQKVGTCSQSVNRGLTLDFCEYCDYDGCNSANGIKTNILIATTIAFLVLFLHF
ncbi:uncharacterized protein LOC130894108 [Diorhabda carinulata]|uniref:uncharacterized protein LOC130894108 n=1 Tax=Diorhabda carinulata TaxID=1163345 RepID=UPI00259FFD36|nr:uncharacterized protein LOC130894108 [Diorhabda carinulata]